MATQQISYGTRTAFGSVSNLNSLAAAYSVGVGVVDNSITEAVNYKIDVYIPLNSTGVSSTGTITIYLLESADNTNFTDGISATSASDQTSSLKNAIAIRQYNATANSQIIIDTFDLPVLSCPKYFSLLITNGSGAALGTGNAVYYTPITYTVV